MTAAQQNFERGRDAGRVEGYDAGFAAGVTEAKERWIGLGFFAGALAGVTISYILWRMV